MDKICVLLNDKKLNYGNIRVLQNEVRKVGYNADIHKNFFSYILAIDFL